MTRRTFLQTPALPAAAAAQAAAGKPNILWICTDQQRFDTISSLGNGAIRTPNIDRLASQGVAFTRAYCQNPICTPSRASFLTGTYPSSIHVHRNGNSHFPEAVSPRLLPRILANAGYDCGLVGKLHLSAAHNRVERRPDDGYRLFEWSHHPKPESFWPLEAHAYQKWLRDQGVDWNKVYRATKIPNWPDRFQPGITERYNEITWGHGRAAAFLRGELKAPWFISLNIFAPHPPFDPAPEYLERIRTSELPPPLFRPTDMETHRRLAKVDHQTSKPQPPAEIHAREMKASYYAMIEHIDHEVGRLLKALDDSGQRDDTIVVFTSDHGEMLGDHGLQAKGCRFYEGAVRVPLIVSWPRRLKQGLRSEALVQLTDLYPTILEAAGLPLPEHTHGKSLLPLLSGASPASQHRDFVRSEYHGTLNLPNSTHANMLRDDRYKLVVYHGHGYGELYDLAEDPGEFVNLWDRLPLKHRLMEQLFDAVMQTTDTGQPRVGRF